MEDATLEIVSQFLTNYYTILHDEPHNMLKFYKDDSLFCYGVEGEGNDGFPNIVGQQKINEKILSLGYAACVVDAAVVQAQKSLHGSVLIVVKGTLRKGEHPQAFMQTFLLAEQPKGYYVKNDVLIFLSQSVIPPISVGTAAQAPAPTVGVSSPENTMDTTKGESFSHKETKPLITESRNGDTLKEEKGIKDVVMTPVLKTTTSNAEKNLIGVPEPDGTKESKSSYATVAARKNDEPVSTPASKPVPAPRATQELEDTRSTRTKPSTEGQHSVCARNIPYTSDQHQVEAVFKQFGEIRSISCHRGMAFIEFASAQSVRKAIERSSQSPPLVIDGREIKVEEKKPKTKKRGSGSSRTRDGSPSTRGGSRAQGQKGPRDRH